VLLRNLGFFKLKMIFLFSTLFILPPPGEILPFPGAFLSEVRRSGANPNFVLGGISGKNRPKFAIFRNLGEGGMKWFYKKY
jgi:hypothetical protein